MNRFYSTLFTSISIAMLLFSACSEDSGSAEEASYDKTALLANISDKIIIPQLETYNEKLTLLEAKADAFVANPDVQELTHVKTAFYEAYLQWQHLQYFDFGPALDNLLLSSTNIYPTDIDQVESNITSGSYDLDGANNTSAKGLPAIDYLLNEVANDLTAYTTAGTANERKQYLQDLITDLQTKAQVTHTAWIAAGGNYRQTFISSTGDDAGSSLSLLVNAVNRVFERHVRDGKIGIPAGVRNIVSGSPEPTRVEGIYGDYSIDLAKESMVGLENILTGKSDNLDGEGLLDYLNAINAQKNGILLSTEITSSLGTVNSKMNSVSQPLKDYVVSNQTAAQDIFDEMQELVILLKVDMPAAFSVSIVYLDSDGD